MSSTLFIIVFLIFSFSEIFVSVQFARIGRTILCKGVIISYAVFLIFLALEYLFKFRVSNYILILVMITLFGHSFIGNYLNVYNKSKYYDRYLHGFGAFSFSLFAYSIIDKTVFHPVIPRLYGSIFMISLGIALGCLLEILEFSNDVRLKTKNQKGLKDTDFDLIGNVIGSIVCGVYAFFFVF